MSPSVPTSPPEWYRRLPEAEQRAVEIQEFQPLMVPGLLQTDGYARAAIAASNRSMTTQQIDDKVSERLRRQEIIATADAPLLHFVVDERVLSARFRESGIMQDQLEHLVATAEMPRVEILVVPSATRDHPGLEGGFKLLRLPEPDGDVLLYAEAPAIGGLVPDNKAVQMHIWKMASLRGVALPPEQSLAVIKQARQGETRGD